MNGPQHYAKAEELLEESLSKHWEARPGYIERAKVHVMLAALAQPVEMQSRHKPVIDEWFKVLGLVVEPQPALRFEPKCNLGRVLQQHTQPCGPGCEYPPLRHG